MNQLILVGLLASLSLLNPGCTASTPPTFNAKLTQPPTPQDLDDYEEDLNYDISDPMFESSIDNDLDFDELLTAAGRRNNATNKPPVYMNNMNNDTRLAFGPLFDFVEFVLRPTSAFENIVEMRTSPLKPQSDDHEDYQDDIDFNLNGTTVKENVTISEPDIEPTWLQRQNVCRSKVVYERDWKSKFEYWLLNTCNDKPDSEFCYTKIQAGLKGFEIYSVTSCCPNYHLNKSSDSCESTNIDPDLFQLLKAYIKSINSTVQEYFKNDTKSKLERLKFTREMNIIYSELALDVTNRLNSTRLTVFLWDNATMIDHVRNLLRTSLKISTSQRLDQILDSIRYHMGRMHYSTHSFYSNSMRMESLSRGKTLRLSTIDLENKTAEFVNCREIVQKNQYHKKIDASKNHNYHLIIHRLQPDSLLLPQTKTVLQLLGEKLSRVEKSGADNGNTRFSTFARIFTKCQDLVQKELNKPNKVNSPMTIFIPMDSAFKSLRRDQIESLWSDRTCAFKFVMQNILNEEICPSQLIKHDAEYSSRTQKADFIPAPEDNGTMSLYFNGQKVNLGKSFIGSNGAIYRLSSLELTGVVDFLYDIVVGFRKRFSNHFIESLTSNWLDELKNESRDVTLFMPFELAAQKNATNITNPVTNSTSIRDYMVRPRITFYELNNGDLIQSLTGRSYLINTYPFENPLSDIIMRFIPKRNLERKSINCQQLEVPDLNACNAQLIVFKSELNRIPALNSESILEFIKHDTDLSIFNSLVQFCGLECKNLLTNFNHSKGHTVLLPVNEFFNRALYNFQKFSNDIPMFVRTIKSNIFSGTFCGFYLKNDVFIENLRGHKSKARKIYARIQSPDVYLSKNGLIAHKTSSF